MDEDQRQTRLQGTSAYHLFAPPTILGAPRPTNTVKKKAQAPGSRAISIAQNDASHQNTNPSTRRAARPLIAIRPLLPLLAHRPPSHPLARKDRPRRAFSRVSRAGSQQICTMSLSATFSSLRRRFRWTRRTFSSGGTLIEGSCRTCTRWRGISIAFR